MSASFKLKSEVTEVSSQLSRQAAADVVALVVIQVEEYSYLKTSMQSPR